MVKSEDGLGSFIVWLVFELRVVLRGIVFFNLRVCVNFGGLVLELNDSVFSWIFIGIEFLLCVRYLIGNYIYYY